MTDDPHKGTLERGLYAAGRRLRLLALALAVPCLVLAAAPARGQGVVATEYAVKAAFLYHFAKFIEWPASVGGPNPETVTLCMVGDDPFGDALDELGARGAEGLAEGVRVKVRHVVAPGRQEAGTGCHIAFISNSERSHLKAHLEAARRGHVVTVSDLTGFARDGGMIQFVLEDGRVRFWINRSAAARAGVRISSRLLAVARLVGEGP
jgi:hypothetical protein